MIGSRVKANPPPATPNPIFVKAAQTNATGQLVRKPTATQ